MAVRSRRAVLTLLEGAWPDRALETTARKWMGRALSFPPGAAQQGRGPLWFQDLPLPRLSVMETTIFGFSSPGQLPAELLSGAAVGRR